MNQPSSPPLGPDGPVDFSFASLVNAAFLSFADDKVLITQTCLDDLGGRAVRFPNESEAYCSCYTQEITTHYTKSKYQYLEQLSQAEQEKEMLSVILDCINTYQKAIFDGSRLDDNLQP